MTALNLASTFIIPNLSKQDKIQATVIALLFLILLYSAPSALLVYWTTNNALLLLKTLVRTFTPDIIKKQLSILFLWRYHSSTKLTAIFLIIAILLASNKIQALSLLPFRITRFFDPVSDIIFITILLKISIPYLKNNFQLKKFSPTYIFTCLVLALISFRLISVYGFLDARHYLSKQLLASILAINYAIHFFTLKHLLNYFIHTFNKNKINIQKLYFPSCLTAIGIIFFYFPISIYLSDTSQLPIPPKTAFSYLILCAQVVFFVYLILYFTFNRLRPYLSIIALFLTLSSIIYGFVIVPDYGSFDHFNFQNAEAIFSVSQEKVRTDIIVLISVLIISTLLAIYASKFMRFLLSFLAFISITLPAYQLYKQIHIVEEKTFSSDQEEIAQWKKFFSLSKDKPNVVVLMTDAFSGGPVFQEILDKNPEFKKQLDGFTWYYDTLSSGQWTGVGKPSIISGINGHPIAINHEIKPPQTIREKVNTNWEIFFNSLRSNGISLSVMDYIFLDTKRHTLSNNDIMTKKFNHINSLFEKNFHPSYSPTLSNIKVALYHLSLLRISPLSLKYNFQTLGVKKLDRDTHNALSVYNHRTSLYTIPLLSDTENTNPTYKFFSILMSHYPWMIDENCNITKQTPYHNIEGARITIKNQYSCTIKGIVNYIEWLKNNNVYDNTMLIIVADHANSDTVFNEKISSGIAPLGHTHFPLMLVKPFNQHGELKIDTTSRMANWDTSQIVLNAFNIGDKKMPWLNNNRLRCFITWNNSDNWGADLDGSLYAFRTKTCITGDSWVEDNYQQIPVDEDDGHRLKQMQ